MGPTSTSAVTVAQELGSAPVEAGRVLPFEILGAYATPAVVPQEASRMRVQVLAKGNEDDPVSTNVKFRLTPGADYLTAYLFEDARDLRNLYPFIAPAVFDPDNILYGPNADPSAGYLQHQVRVSLLTPVSSFGLGSDVVPGSVQVLRNGVTENCFSSTPAKAIF
jgi:hypothetical protein